MFQTNFNLKQSKKLENERPINLVARWDNRKLVYATGEKILLKYFETEKGKKLSQRAKTCFVGFSEFNTRLDYIEATTKDAFRKFVNDNNRQPEPSELKKILDVRLRNMQESRAQTLFEFVAKFIEEAGTTQINRSTGLKKAYGTQRLYRNGLRRLQEFEVYYGTKVDFNSIDMEFFDRYVEFLSIELQLAQNTVARYITTLKVFMNEATERGFNTNLAFRNKRFKVSEESVYRIYLNEDELNEMFNLDLSKTKRLEKVRDLFIVGCWTALRYDDLVNIAPENVTKDNISIKTQKTGEVVVLPLHRMVRSVMERYKDYPNSLPPGISNVKMNLFLKEVGRLMPSQNENVQTSLTRGGKRVTQTKARWECLTVHTARRSFATNLYLAGVSSLTIMKLTGHKSEKVFLSYLKASPLENANIVQKHWDKEEAKSTGASEHRGNQDMIPNEARA
jgi:integrase